MKRNSKLKVPNDNNNVPPSKVELKTRSSNLSDSTQDDSSIFGIRSNNDSNFTRPSMTEERPSQYQQRLSIKSTLSGVQRQEAEFVADLINDWREYSEEQFILQFLLALKTIEIERDIIPLQEVKITLAHLYADACRK